MSKSVKSSSPGGRPASKGWPLVVYIWMIGLGILGYLGGQLVLDANDHPAHWLLGVGGLVVGWLIGWVWYRYRGDI